jgi:predicted enzyme related to lactoylglutathione lyase
MLSNSPVSPILPCVDIDGAKRFYGEILGLEEVPMPNSEMAQGAAVYVCGQGTMLYIYTSETPTKADHTAVVWMVDDLDTEVTKLAEKGVTFEQYDMPGIKTDDRGIAVHDEIKSAWFKDPEGNILSINQMG